MIRGSLQRRVMAVVLSTTCAALLLSAVALMLYEVGTYRDAWIRDLTTQADLIARSTAPALAFDDRKAASENLALLKLRPQIEAAAVYQADGSLFASYRSAQAEDAPLPAQPEADGARFDRRHVALYQQVSQDGELLGTVYLRSRYDLVGRLTDYLVILVLVMLASLVASTLVLKRLRDSITAPILAVTEVARKVLQQRNYELRAPKTTEDEVGVLVDAFNDMLLEVGRRTEALERSNRDLHTEMAERHKAEDALRAADRRKDEFLATLAHELRNPLAPLANALEILKRSDTKPELRERARAIMERQLKQMVHLIDDLLDLSRITTGKLVLQRERLDLAQVLRGAIEIADPMLRASGHHLTVNLGDTPLWVEGDPARLAQVFSNLLNNAVKYTSPGGRITVDAEPQGEQVAVRISDTGIGIAPEMQDAIFEMFMQVDKSLERGRAGLGVGLTLARQLVELHGGSIGVYSEGLGRGAVFTVRLALHAPPGRSQDAPGSGDAAAQDHPLRVLVADDNVDFANSLGAMLESLGHSVRVVHDGRSAYDLAIADPPDIGLFDIGMPGLNGYELARHLRAHPATRHLRMAAITGWGQQTDRQQASEAGFDHHLVKPVAFERVLELLRGSPELQH
jgi:signal transduction histidine kinase/ActR/RegA family two-component response regulator